MILFELLVTSALVCLIWLIQILHYPSFHFYGKENFRVAMEFHQRRISYLVIPLMFAELGMAILTAIKTPSVMSLISLSLVILIWATTFLFLVPVHSKLTEYNSVLITKLVNRNMIRTGLWTVKLIVILL